MGYSIRGTAWLVLQDALKDRVVDEVDGSRKLELERLHPLHAAHWPMAMAGELKSATVVLRAIDQRIRLLGLDQPPAADKGRGPVSIIQGAG